MVEIFVCSERSVVGSRLELKPKPYRAFSRENIKLSYKGFLERAPTPASDEMMKGSEVFIHQHLKTLMWKVLSITGLFSIRLHVASRGIEDMRNTTYVCLSSLNISKRRSLRAPIVISYGRGLLYRGPRLLVIVVCSC